MRSAGSGAGSAAYSEQDLLETQAAALDDALWAAVVALEERADLLRRVQALLRDAGPSTVGLETAE